MSNVPIFVNSRDRLSCLRELLAWLDSAGYKNIVIIDNASTYAPLIQFFERCKYRVIVLNQNFGHTALWQIDDLKPVVDSGYFVWTDPDVIPDVCSPKDAVEFFQYLLEKYSGYVKAGFGLRFDDLPDHYHLKAEVMQWEQSLYSQEVEPNVFVAPIDTTFALYRPGSSYCLTPSLRTAGLYCARHTPWYLDTKDLDEEEQYYRAHALSNVTHWNVSGSVPRIVIESTPTPSGVWPRFGRHED